MAERRHRRGRGYEVESVWKGHSDYIPAVRAAVSDTMVAVMSRCVDDAHQNVPVATATLQRSIKFNPPTRRGDEISGEWGSFGVFYALAVETGIRALVGPNREDADDVKRLPTRKNKGAKNFLRNAADKNYLDFKPILRRELARRRVR